MTEVQNAVQDSASNGIGGLSKATTLASVLLHHLSGFDPTLTKKLSFDGARREAETSNLRHVLSHTFYYL